MMALTDKSQQNIWDSERRRLSNESFHFPNFSGLLLLLLLFEHIVA